MEHLSNKESYNEINDFLQNLPKNFSILQEEIDIEIQMAYFERIKKIKGKLKIDAEKLPIKIAELNLNETSVEEKKDILIQLASFDDVKAYRAIENFTKNESNTDLKAWATLAMQESRMMMESSLLEESQVFISTGMGGKGDKLRYFIVSFLNEETEFTAAQKNLLLKELEYSLQQHNSEIEEIKFNRKFALITALIPIKEPIKDILKNAIDECLALGMNLSEHFLVTNVKKMDIEEIEVFLKEQFEEELSDEDFDDIPLDDNDFGKEF